MDRDRRAAFLILKDIEDHASYSNIALNVYLKDPEIVSHAFVRELVYGTLKQQLLLDYNIDRLLSKPGARLKTNERVLLRMGLYQLVFMDSVSEYAAVDEAVKLARKFIKGQQGFINGVLRSFVRGGSALLLPQPQDQITYLSTKYSYLPWIVSLWVDAYGVDTAEELMKAGNAIPPLTLRTNLMKIDRDDLINRLQSLGYVAEPGPHSDTAIHVKGGDVLSESLYKNGFFSVQDESSQVAIAMLNPGPGEVCVDLCAAPGGKAFSAAERAGDSGRIYAYDIYPRKIAHMEEEAQRLEIKSVCAAVSDGTVLKPELLGAADCVWVDAPCSGLGVIRRKPEIKLKPQDDNRRALPGQQLALLETASNYVKPKGRLMYCTCTVNPAENEEITDTFLKNHPGFIQEERRQLLPFAEGTDGFYICLMRRQND
jgi:16S rRNA (cytosine967-C5)-methyltransferase